jgi:hypothetical protein
VPVSEHEELLFDRASPVVTASRGGASGLDTRGLGISRGGSSNRGANSIRGANSTRGGNSARGRGQGPRLRGRPRLEVPRDSPPVRNGNPGRRAGTPNSRPVNTIPSGPQVPTSRSTRNSNRTNN